MVLRSQSTAISSVARRNLINTCREYTKVSLEKPTGIFLTSRNCILTPTCKYLLLAINYLNAIMGGGERGYTKVNLSSSQILPSDALLPAHWSQLCSRDVREIRICLVLSSLVFWFIAFYSGNSINVVKKARGYELNMTGDHRNPDLLSPKEIFKPAPCTYLSAFLLQKSL